MPAWLHIDRALVRSRLGRRLFLTICVAVVVPAGVVLALTHRAADANALANSHAAQRAEMGNFAMTLLERLQVSHAMLGRIGGDARARAGEVDEPLLEPYFDAVERIDPATDPGQATSPLARRLLQLSRSELQGANLLVLPAGPGHPQATIVLLERRAGPGGELLLAGQVRQRHLWGDPEDIALGGQVCVRAGQVPLACVGDAPAADERREVTDSRDLFLAAEFSAPVWTLTATRRAEPAMTTRLVFLVPVAVGMLLLVLLLSSVEIRRILVPLDALVARINALGHGPVVASAARGEDELQVLTSAFGQMENRITRQMETLRTLARIDQLILQRMPVGVVVDVIIERVLLVTGAVAVGITLEGRDGTLQHFVRAPGERNGSAEGGALDAPLDSTWLEQHRVAGRWRTAQAVGPGLQRLGVACANVVVLGSPPHQGWLALARALPDTKPGPEILAEVREIAERVAVAMAVHAHETVLQFQARHDPLTGLPNRLAATEALGKAIAHSDMDQGGFAVIFIDLDRFKSINDGLGHGLGDQILVRTAERIRQCIGSADLVARFGGDEFFVLLRDVQSPAEAARATARLSSAFETPLLADGIELVVGFSAGIALYPRHGGDAGELIHNSDVAMYRAKKNGGGRLEFFEAEMNEAALGRVQMENDLRLAIRASALTVHYQPRVDSRSGSIVGAEALVRWLHPSKGNISPVVFIALAEECGLIEELGLYVLGEACRQLGDWRRAGLRLPMMAINISSYQLRSGALIESIGTAVDDAGIAWGDLEIEVTESLLINDTGGASSQLQAIRESGATVAIDDFGTGYSSLAYLTRLPIDTLKIDRAFISDLDSPGAATVVRSIIALATALDKSVVAEGVESMDHVRALAGWGCHVIQGYAYHRPLHPQDMAAELARDPATRLAGAQDHAHSSAT